MRRGGATGGREKRWAVEEEYVHVKGGGGGAEVGREKERGWVKEGWREIDRQTETETERERQTDRERQRQKERDRQTETERERARHTHTQSLYTVLQSGVEEASLVRTQLLYSYCLPPSKI